MKKKVLCIGLIVILVAIVAVVIINFGGNGNLETTTSQEERSEENLEEWQNVITKFMQACEEKDIDKVEETIDTVGFVYMYNGAYGITGKAGTIFPTSGFDETYKSLIEESNNTDMTDEALNLIKGKTINNSIFESYNIANFSDLEKLDNTENLYKTIVTLDNDEIYDFYLFNNDGYKIVACAYDEESPSQVKNTTVSNTKSATTNVLTVGDYTLKYGTYKGNGTYLNGGESYDNTFILNSDGTCTYTTVTDSVTENYSGTYTVTRDSWYGIENTGESAAFDCIKVNWSNGSSDIFAVKQNSLSSMDVEMNYVEN